MPIELLAPDNQTSPGILEVSYGTLERLIKQGAPTTASFAAMLGAAPIAGTEPLPVAITTLCYSGHAALERANLVRQQIAAELDRDVSLTSLQPLVQELLDLVPLALVES